MMMTNNEKNGEAKQRENEEKKNRNECVVS